jgi:membrane-associated phospholipid phosphatase
MNGLSGNVHSFAIDKPHLPDTVTNTNLILAVTLGPIIGVALTQHFFIRSAHDFHHFLLSFWTAFGYTFSICETVKTFSGRLRPDFLARVQEFGHGQDDLSIYEVREAHLSFPSGHSAVAAVGATVFTCYLAGKLGVFQPNGGGQTWKIFLCMGTQFISWAVAVTRTQDYRHNFSDVMAGNMLGTTMSCLAYFQFFHPLTSELAFWPKTREAELARKRKGYITGDQTLRLMAIAESGGGCLAPHLAEFNAHEWSTADAVRRAYELSHGDKNINTEKIRRLTRGSAGSLDGVGRPVGRVDALA